MLPRSFTCRLLFVGALFAPLSTARAHHGPPHGEEDEFLRPPSASPLQPAATRLVQAWPAFLLPGAIVLLFAADAAGKSLRKTSH